MVNLMFSHRGVSVKTLGRFVVSGGGQKGWPVNRVPITLIIQRYSLPVVDFVKVVSWPLTDKKCENL